MSVVVCCSQRDAGHCHRSLFGFLDQLPVDWYVKVIAWFWGPVVTVVHPPPSDFCTLTGMTANTNNWMCWPMNINYRQTKRKRKSQRKERKKSKSSHLIQLLMGFQMMARDAFCISSRIVSIHYQSVNIFYYLSIMIVALVGHLLIKSPSID